MTNEELIGYFGMRGLNLTLPVNNINRIIVSPGQPTRTEIVYSWDLWIDTEDDFALVLCDADFPEAPILDSDAKRCLWLNDNLARVESEAAQRVREDNVFRDFY